MNCEVKIQIDNEMFRFDASKAQKLKTCSDQVGMLIDERMDTDPDNSETIVIDICGQDFTHKEVKTALDYLEHYNFDPPTYGKVSFCNI